MENSIFTSCLDRMYSPWNNAIHCMNFLFCTVGTYRPISILGRDHTAFWEICKWQWLWTTSLGYEACTFLFCLTTEASFNPANYKGAQCPISLSTPRWSRDDLTFHEGACWCLMFDKTPLPTPEIRSDGEEYLPAADLDGPVWSEEPVPDSQEYQCIHLIPRPATPPLQPNQVEICPEPGSMDIDIPEDIPYLINVLEELFLDFDLLAHSVMEY